MRSGWNRDIYKAGMKITGRKSERGFMDYIKVTDEKIALMLKDYPFVSVLYPILLLGVSV